METRVVFEEKIALDPKDLNKVATKSIDTIVLEKLKNKLEGRCSSSGWVIPNTMKLLSRSMCQSMSGQFTGTMISWVQVEGTVIYPTDGMVVSGIVSKKNKMGLFVDYKNAIQIMVPRDLHLGDMSFDSIRIGDSVDVEIKKSKYQINDEYILSVGIYKGVTGVEGVEGVSDVEAVAVEGGMEEFDIGIGEEGKEEGKEEEEAE
jgi:DNA-directed RNA polymerase subunit E'/Rpb7